MLFRFLLTIVLPRLFLGGAGAVALLGFGTDGMLPTLGAWVVTVLWTFAAVTGGSPYRRPVPEPREDRRTDEERKQREDFWIGVVGFGVLALLFVGCCLFAAIRAAFDKGDRELFAVALGFTDGFVTLLMLYWFNGWQSFIRAEAWHEVRRAHRRHRKMIGEELPMPVLAAELLALGGEASPAEVWKASNDILKRIAEAARKAAEEAAKAARERSKPVPTEEPSFTPPLSLDDAEYAKPIPLPLPDDPAELRAEWEARRKAAREYATRKGLPPDVLAGELERIDEEYRKRGIAT